jgi:hypothetical protein
LKVAAVCAFLAWEWMSLARTLDANGNGHKQDINFTVSSAQSLSVSHIGMCELIKLCLAERERRFSGYDRRPVRPETIPKLVALAVRFMRTRTSKAMRRETFFKASTRRSTAFTRRSP